jgi:hypothetical protein
VVKIITEILLRDCLFSMESWRIPANPEPVEIMAWNNVGKISAVA